MHDREALDKADAFFVMIYNTMGQNMAKPEEGDEPADGNDLQEAEVLPDHPLWLTAVGLQDGKRQAPVKYLPHTEFQDLADMNALSEQRVSYSTLRRSYYHPSGWVRYLKIRSRGPHGRCPICAELTEQTKKAVTTEEINDIRERKQAHVDRVKNDRTCGCREDAMAEEAARNPSADGFGELGKCELDGMDQAKYKIPRNLESNKSFEGLWRPQLHVTGVTIKGHLEAYFLMGPDLKKDANMNCTVLARALDVAFSDHVAEGKALPRTWTSHVDNTAREGKNQHFKVFHDYLVSKGVFEATGVEMFQFGHTHNAQDQRFNIATTVLNKAPCLEDPADFANYLRTHLRPARGRRLHVEVLEHTLDFQAWFSVLETNISGLASTASEKSTNHAWRSILRKHLGGHEGSTTWQVENPHPLWAGVPEHDMDVIGLVKEFMSESRLSQLPFLALPHNVVERLQPENLKVAPRRALSKVELQKYRATADAVEKEPWYLMKAAAYLRKLCDTNESKVQLAPMELNLIFQYKVSESLNLAPRSLVGCDWAPGPVRKVTYEKATAGEIRKRIHAKSAQPKALRAPKAKAKGKPKAKVKAKAAPGAANDVKDDESDAESEALNHDQQPDDVEQQPNEEVELPDDLLDAPDGRVAEPDSDIQLGCGKCRRSPQGCAVCLRRALRALRGRGHRDRGGNGGLLAGT